ncbi:type IV secretory system conjugative DNA transfer family protein [Rhizobium sp. NTR19]|uniref:Type IV secretory system conjugative DNA transfer family protein n=1 Tax=Neorhizobium turbinariae TaxID=2937795 RepID=A0ABT0IXW1_9HYPH|nr:type IV secretory system conjugative DNA transfer family protein [Neorhizobium turbinariae]MCK8782722.1 type IV secretory system conjugative DNA transfer family protein [Neorhizobium turbinariae]
MNSLTPALPSILVLLTASGLYGWSRRGRERGAAWGTVLFAALLIVASLLAVWAIIAAGWASVSSSRSGVVEKLAASIDAILAIILSGTLPSLVLVGVIVVAAVSWIVCSGEFGKAWAILFPASHVVADGPWKAAFLTESDIADLIRLQNGLPLGLTKGGRIVRYAKNDERGWIGGHHAVISGTRGGKGVSAIIPAIFDHDGPVVALDIKGELVDTTIASRTVKGQRVVALDPFRTSKSSRIEGQKPIGFNPMAFIRPAHRSRDAAVLADGMIVPEQGSGAHFSDRARACLQTTIEVVHELSEAPTLHEVRGLILSAGFLDTLTAWAETPKLAGGRAAELAGSFLAMGDKERGSIISTVAKSLEWTGADAMRGFLGVKTGINLESLLRGDTDLFIVIPLDQVTAQAGFMRLMANLLLALMVQQQERQPARKQVLFVADEFTRLGRLDRIVDIATVAAGINLETLFILQDKGSLEAVYGQSADTILGSCATVRIFNLGRGDSRTAEWASKLAGYQTLRTQSTSAAAGSKTASTSSAEVREPLLTAADILELPTSEMLCFIRGRKPLRMQRILWYKLRRYRSD